MDDAQLAKAFAHLTADEFAELVEGFGESGQPIAKDSDSFRILWDL